MKLRSALPAVLAAGATALSFEVVGAVAQDERPERSDRGSIMREGQMERHHDRMIRHMREMPERMTRMMDRHHDEMMEAMRDMDGGAMGRME